jgi:hypothetical protein
MFSPVAMWKAVNLTGGKLSLSNSELSASPLLILAKMSFFLNKTLAFNTNAITLTVGLKDLFNGG